MRAGGKYAEQLKHPKWQRRRLEMLQSAGFACQKCTCEDKPLHVHHKRYIASRMAWEYADDELIVLCEHCHGVEHGLIPPSFDAVPLRIRVELREAVRAGNSERVQELTREAAAAIQRAAAEASVRDGA